MDVNVLLFDDFETLDAFGPVEVLGKVEEYRLRYFSEHGGTVASAQKTVIVTEPATEADGGGILVVPGGRGTRRLAVFPPFLHFLRGMADDAEYCLSVCTGSALLAGCGALDGRRATSNKKSFAWVKSVRGAVGWEERARWVADGKFYTSSGVSAGMDMALGFVSDRFGRSQAEGIAEQLEYVWNDDCTRDVFARK